MKIIALKGLSNGVKVGDAYEERDGIAKFLISKGLAREFVAVTAPAPEPPRQPVDPVPVKAAPPPVAPDPSPTAPEPEPPRRRPGRPVGASTYQRRDLKVDE